MSGAAFHTLEDEFQTFGNGFMMSGDEYPTPELGFQTQGGERQMLGQMFQTLEANIPTSGNGGVAANSFNNLPERHSHSAHRAA